MKTRRTARQAAHTKALVGMTGPVDVSDPLAPVERAFFDTYPASDTANFHGAWAVYPFLPSGNILISNIDGAGGLFVLKEGAPATVVSRPLPRAPITRLPHPHLPPPPR